MLKFGRLDVDGRLQLMRIWGLKHAECIKLSYGLCGDWCPHFGEPEINPYGKDVHVWRAKINICEKRILYFEEFLDDRKSSKLKDCFCGHKQVTIKNTLGSKVGCINRDCDHWIGGKDYEKTDL